MMRTRAGSKMESSRRFNLQAFVCVLDPNNPMEFLDIGCRNNYKTILVKTFTSLGIVFGKCNKNTNLETILLLILNLRLVSGGGGERGEQLITQRGKQHLGWINKYLN